MYSFLAPFKAFEGRPKMLLNMGHIASCEAINGGKNTKLIDYDGTFKLVGESPAEVLNMYLRWAAKMKSEGAYIYRRPNP